MDNQCLSSHSAANLDPSTMWQARRATTTARLHVHLQKSQLIEWNFILSKFPPVRSLILSHEREQRLFTHFWEAVLRFTGRVLKNETFFRTKFRDNHARSAGIVVASFLSPPRGALLPCSLPVKRQNSSQSSASIRFLDNLPPSASRSRTPAAFRWWTALALARTERSRKGTKSGASLRLVQMYCKWVLVYVVIEHLSVTGRPRTCLKLAYFWCREVGNVAPNKNESNFRPALFSRGICPHRRSKHTSTDTCACVDGKLW